MSYFLRHKPTYGHKKGDLAFNHGGHGIGDQFDSPNSRQMKRIAPPNMTAAETSAFLRAASLEAEAKKKGGKR